MARYKPYSYGQMNLIPVSHGRQILPGTFEYTLSEVIDSMDLCPIPLKMTAKSHLI